MSSDVYDATLLAPDQFQAMGDASSCAMLWTHQMTRLRKYSNIPIAIRVSRC